MDGHTNAVPMAVALLLLFLCLPFRPANAHFGTLQQDFYSDTCPQAEEIVRWTVANFLRRDRSIAAGLLRLHFHDCVVRGCDGSILLDETPSGEPVEKESPANGNTLRGLDVIDAAKSLIELECPFTVSCADILAFAARDAAASAGIPRYPIPSGRRDGRTSLASDIPTNLPFPSPSAAVLTAMFAAKGFSQSEMVVLSGAHSIGGAHCSSFSQRLYNFSAGAAQDPLLNSLDAERLRRACPRPGTLEAEAAALVKVDFDGGSSARMDTSYYRGLMMGKGLLASDQALMTDPQTSRLVRRMAEQPSRWAKKFAAAMVKLGKLDVLTGDDGEIRRSCRFVNRGGFS